MIYLIGGPPKCGKTTLAKKMSRKFKIPWISADTLQVVAREYMSKKEGVQKFPLSTIRKRQNNDLVYKIYTSKEIVSAYTTQAKATYAAVNMVSICEIKEGNDYIIEGYQVEPQLVYKLINKYGKENFRSVFLVREKIRNTISGIMKSTTPNDWIIKRTKNKATYPKIAEMIIEYSSFFEIESKKYGFKFFNMDKGFNKQLAIAEKYLTRSKNH